MTANAAVMQVAMVPWVRDNEHDPFLFKNAEMEAYVGHVDLRSCVVEGFDFDPETIKWWSERDIKAKMAVTKGVPKNVEDVLADMLNFIIELMNSHGLKSLCLWSQGTDFDIALLRNMCQRYDADMEELIPHTQFRDCRTVILEAALKRVSSEDPETWNIIPEDVLSGSYDAYKLYEPLPERYSAGSEAHDALYDARRSSWNTWQALKWLNK